VPAPLARGFEALERLGDLQRDMERLRDRLAPLSGDGAAVTTDDDGDHDATSETPPSDDHPVIDAGPPDAGRSSRRTQ
jgi:hypothetical protein